MTMARLSAGLLARKGSAFPLANAYANPHLDPLPGRREGAGRQHRLSAEKARCRIEPELLTRLRILAARQGRPLRAVLEAAVADYLAAHGEGCPCLRGGERAGAAPASEAACCLALR
ncbi:MAG: hypothetical protein ACJ8H8_12210 [Geminicoccaceae bacterium]